MPDLSMLVTEYMSFRQARGFQPNQKIERLLRQFVATLATSGRADGMLFTQEDTLTWAHAPGGKAPAWMSYRLSAVRGFAAYLAGSGLHVGVPSVRQGVNGSRRATPYLYSNSDIVALMGAADELFATPLRAATMKTLIGLLAVTGMRIGEVVRLHIGDIDLHDGALLIAHAKFGRQRMVVLDPTSCRAIEAYLHLRERQRLGIGPDRPILVTTKGTALCVGTARAAFHQMTQQAGLTPRAGARPRAHDLRHSFATQAMIAAYRAGGDPARTLILLATWLGHANPADTYWYLQAAPEVAAQAALRLEPPASDGHVATGRDGAL